MVPFWSEFGKIYTDKVFIPEKKFQDLIQATIIASRRRKVVNSFVPTNSNNSKAIKRPNACFCMEDHLVEVYAEELLK